jgi:hypothetical protein
VEKVVEGFRQEAFVSKFVDYGLPDAFDAEVSRIRSDTA